MTEKTCAIIPARDGWRLAFHDNSDHSLYFWPIVAWAVKELPYPPDDKERARLEPWRWLVPIAPGLADVEEWPYLVAGPDGYFYDQSDGRYLTEQDAIETLKAREERREATEIAKRDALLKREGKP